MPKKIVVIDDEQDILEIVKATLKTKGYHIHGANDGEQGWQLIKQQRPDLIICDLKMPKMSGLELTRKLKASDELKDIPIIILSAITQESDKPEEFWRAGLKADDFISKPFDPLDLLGRVEYIFRKKDYVSSGAKSSDKKGETGVVLPEERTDHMAREESGSRVPQSEKKPEEVVKDFVEAWNTRDFKREFKSIGEEMTGGLSQPDYIRRRMQCYQEEKGQYSTQKVVEVEDSKISKNLASVVIIREDKRGARKERKRQSFALRKTSDGWKIVNVRSKNIE